MTSTSVFGKPVNRPNAPVVEEPVEEEENEQKFSAHKPASVKGKSKGNVTSQKQSG